MSTEEKQENCEACLFSCAETFACTLDDKTCVAESEFVPELTAEDMFKFFYMLLYSSNGEMSVPVEALGRVTKDMHLIPTYDRKTKRYVIKTSLQPPTVPKKARRRGKMKIVRAQVSQRAMIAAANILNN